MLKGQSARVGFYNKGDKSAFVDIVYKDPKAKSETKRLAFYVYNKDTPDKIFDMSEA